MHISRKDILEVADICSLNVCDCLLSERGERTFITLLSPQKQMTSQHFYPHLLSFFSIAYSCYMVHLSPHFLPTLTPHPPPSCHTHSLLLVICSSHLHCCHFSPLSITISWSYAHIFSLSSFCLMTNPVISLSTFVSTSC